MPFQFSLSSKLGLTLEGKNLQLKEQILMFKYRYRFGRPPKHKKRSHNPL